MKPVIRVAIASALALTAFGAFAQNASAVLHTRATAATCANCHGTNGKAVEGSSVPSLAGTPRDAMLASMKAFKDGSRPATVMHQLSKGLTDAQIDALATYFAAQKR